MDLRNALIMQVLVSVLAVPTEDPDTKSGYG